MGSETSAGSPRARFAPLPRRYARCRSRAVSWPHFMTGKSGKRQRKPQRKCIFCGEGGTHGNPMTQEHLWPEWMHEYLPNVPGAHTQAGRRDFTGGRLIAAHKIRQGHVFVRAFRVVCKRCNTGWMSGIETAAKPILIPLLRGQRIKLLRNDKRALAAWVALKTMVYDCKDQKQAVLDQFARDDFREQGKLPRGLHIWIGAHDLSDWYAQINYRSVLANLNPETPRTGFRNVQTTAFGIGHLFTLTFVTALDEFKFKPIGYKRVLRELWPLRDPPIMFPLPNISEAEVGRLGDPLLSLSEPFARWRRDPFTFA
jgi:hypothetical protein